MSFNMYLLNHIGTTGIFSVKLSQLWEKPFACAFVIN